MLGFFRARRGPAVAFRFRDPYDNSSNGMTEAPTAGDQVIGSGDGLTDRFALTKDVKAVVGVFDLTRPYFGYDSSNVFKQVGTV